MQKRNTILNYFFLAVLFLVLYSVAKIADTQQLHGDRFDPPPHAFSSLDWWLYPIENNRFNRPVTGDNENPFSLKGAFFSEQSNRWWVGGSGGVNENNENDKIVLSTTDEGKNWTIQETPPKGIPTALLFSKNNNGRFIGSDNKIYLEKEKNDTTGISKDIIPLFISKSGEKAFAVSTKGIYAFYTTSDGGTTWYKSGVYTNRNAPWIYAAYLVAFIFFIFIIRRMKNIRSCLSFMQSDAPLENERGDRLNIPPLLRSLREFMRSEGTDPHSVFAIRAPWGRGKTSAMKMLRKQLAANGVRSVWFSPWNHQKEHLMLAPLLSAIVAEAIPAWFSNRGIIFRARLFIERLISKAHDPLISWFKPGVALLGVFFVSYTFFIIFSFISTPEDVRQLMASLYNAFGFHDLAQALPDEKAALIISPLFSIPYEGYLFISSLFTMGTPKVFEVLFLLRENPVYAIGSLFLLYLFFSAWFLFSYFLRPFPDKPALLLTNIVRSRFNLKEAEGQTNFRQRFNHYFKEVCDALSPRTLTIFVDDIDRCDADKAVEMLEAINYLSSNGKCYIVLGMAREIVEAQVGEAYKTLAGRLANFEAIESRETNNKKDAPTGKDCKDFAQNYLKKLIQLEVQIPQPTRQQCIDLADGQYNKEAKIKEGGLKAYREAARQAYEGWQLQWMEMRTVMLSIFLIGAFILLPFSFLSWEEVIIDYRGQEKTKLLKQVDENDYLKNISLYERYLTMKYQAEKESSTLASLKDLKIKQKQLEKDHNHYEELIRNGNLISAKRFYNSLFQHDLERITKSEKYRAWEEGGKIKATTKPHAEEQTKENRTTSAEQSDTKSARMIAIIMIIFMSFLFILTKDIYKVEEPEEYKKALKRWIPFLHDRKKLLSPRELKRFINLSRFMALRINYEAYFSSKRFNFYAFSIYKHPEREGFLILFLWLLLTLLGLSEWWGSCSTVLIAPLFIWWSINPKKVKERNEAWAQKKERDKKVKNRKLSPPPVELSEDVIVGLTALYVEAYPNGTPTEKQDQKMIDELSNKWNKERALYLKEEEGKNKTFFKEVSKENVELFLSALGEVPPPLT